MESQNPISKHCVTCSITFTLLPKRRLSRMSQDAIYQSNRVVKDQVFPLEISNFALRHSFSSRWRATHSEGLSLASQWQFQIFFCESLERFRSFLLVRLSCVQQ